MGGRNMHRAMKALIGKDVSVPISKSASAPDVTVAHPLSLDDLITLLTIAYRQRDPEEDKGYPEEDCICYADPSTLQCITRLPRTNCYHARRFLIESGIVTFDETKTCKNIYFPNLKKTYNNVYQINWPRLSLLAHNAPWLENVTNAIREESIEKQSDGEAVQPPNGDVPPPNGDVPPRNTKNREKITENNINSSTTTNESSIKDTQWAEVYRQYIIAKYGLTSNEPNTNQPIRINFIEGATKGKAPDRIKAVIDEFGKEYKPPKNPSKEGWLKWIGKLVKELGKISQRRQATPEDLAAFAAPEREVTPQEAAAQDAAQAIEDGWEKLVNGLALDTLPPDELDKLKGEFHKVLGRYATAKVAVRVNNFVARIQRENGGSFEALRKQCPEADQRVSLLRGCLEKEGL